MARAPIRIVPQHEIAGGLQEPPAFRLARAHSVFSDRAGRFETLAARGQGAPDFLRLMAALARAQQSALEASSAPSLPQQSHFERCAQHGLPPLGTDLPLDAAWRQALQHIVRKLAPDAPQPVQLLLATLCALEPAILDEQAQRLLSMDFPALDAASVPFIGAALQVHWVNLAAALGESVVRKLDVPNVCPVCGSLPLASVQRIDVPVPGTRYLHCVLCATDWHLGRGVCSQCEAPDKLAYYHIEADSDAVRGEACEECKGYIKSINHEKNQQADPVADDLATLALDVLLDEAGYQRASPSLFFVPGQG